MKLPAYPTFLHHRHKKQGTHNLCIPCDNFLYSLHHTFAIYKPVEIMENRLALFDNFNSQFYVNIWMQFYGWAVGAQGFDVLFQIDFTFIDFIASGFFQLFRDFFTGNSTEEFAAGTAFYLHGYSDFF